jgi:ParB family chromosome partitioning protein
MAGMAKAKTAAGKRPVTKTGKPRARKGVKLKPTELSARDLKLDGVPDDLRPLADAVDAAGGAVLAAYKEPLGGNVLLLCALPIDKVAPTAFQRDVSDAHVLKLTRAMDKTRRFLDPIIATRALEEREDGAGFVTPNGHHRLVALRELGAKTILALIVPEAKVAYQILALNIEKAHNLREKALEVVRMVHDLEKTGGGLGEKDLELELEEPALVTLGFAYEKRGRLGGGAYQPILKKVDAFLPGSLASSRAERERRAELVLAFDEAVGEAVARLKEKGFESPYLRAFVVARVNPLRFIKGEPPPFDKLFDDMTRRARGMNADKIKPGDVARSGGPPEAAE